MGAITPDLIWKGKTVGHKHIASSVYNHLKQHPQEQFTAQQIATAIGASDGGVRTACRNMKSAGKAIKETRISAHRTTYCYTRPAHNKSPAAPGNGTVTVDNTQQHGAGAGGNGAIHEVTLTIPVLGGQVSMTLAAARKLHEDLNQLFPKT